MANILFFIMILIFLGYGGHPVAQPNLPPVTASPPTGQPGCPQLSYQDYANIIAGRQMDPEILLKCVNLEGWRQYAADMDRIWERFEKKSLNPMRAWATQELGAPGMVSGTVFYPFSGPDVVNLLTFFPHARFYILIALEPVGTLPVFKPGENEPFFNSLEAALSELLQFNFFFTKKMENSLIKQELQGVLPLLLFFLGQEQVQILAVQEWVMQPDGSLCEDPAPGGAKIPTSGIPGVKIVFQRQGGGSEQTLYYCQFNLSNASWRRQPCFSNFIKEFALFQTLIKAASYLMFKPHFGDIRQFILDHSQTVLQTDEGIPLIYFDPEKWERRFYGRYSCPIQLFSNCFQPELAAIYENDQNIPPLPFGIGYHHRRHSSNLMVAARKVVVAGGAAP